MHVDALVSGNWVPVVDVWLLAALVRWRPPRRAVGALIVGLAFIIELGFLGGRGVGGAHVSWWSTESRDRADHWVERNRPTDVTRR
jgi:hypothetical protein